MATLLELPKGENSLMVAYRAVEEGGKLDDANRVVAIYEQHFVTKAAPVKPDQKTFERISLVDPTIRTVVRSSTASRP
jgi:hypothetical protein